MLFERKKKKKKKKKKILNIIGYQIWYYVT